MKILKKIIISLFCFSAFLSCLILSSCNINIPILDRLGEKKIVCTIFPAYDWSLEILQGEAGRIDVTCLTSNGADLHSYEPTVSDVMEIKSADIFIYVGGESDSWVEDAIKDATNPNMKVINLLETLGESAKEEEIQEGMLGESDGESDEHVWLSLKNAQVFVDVIAAALGEIDAEYKDYYLENAQTYKAKLKNLDDEFTLAASESTKNTLIFADRFPFRYLVDDYSLNYYAAFSGCSDGSDIDAAVVIFLANKIDELGIKVILVIEGTNNTALAGRVKECTTEKNQEILVLNSMQSVDASKSASYLEIMQQNLEVIKKALA